MMVGFTDRARGAVVMTNGEGDGLVFELLNAISNEYGWGVSWPVPPRPRVAQPAHRRSGRQSAAAAR